MLQLMGLLRNSQHSKKSYLALPFRGDSQRQPDYIKPFLENIKKIYGLPLTVVRDMREEIAVSVSEVFTGVAQQICHFQWHFPIFQDFLYPIFSIFPIGFI